MPRGWHPLPNINATDNLLVVRGAGGSTYSAREPPLRRGTVGLLAQLVDFAAELVDLAPQLAEGIQ
jgi:hypothetical protein